MERTYWPYFDPEYENLSQRINPPRVSIDNTTCKECTLVKVDSVNRHGILLEVVQVLIDLNLTILKAYISSDGGWFMDVFHVTDQEGNKVTDPETIDHIEKVSQSSSVKPILLSYDKFRGIEQALGPKSYKVKGEQGGTLGDGKRVGVHSIGDYTTIELVGTDRPGLLSEVSAVLANLHCNVLGAEMWTHNTRVACVVYVNDDTTCRAVDDPARLSAMEEQLRNVLRGDGEDRRGSRTHISAGSTHPDRRLHQMMFADRDYEGGGGEAQEGDEPMSLKAIVSIDCCEDKRYSLVTVRCKDRPKLLFDIVCTLTDMEYVVFHASVSSNGPMALQEYYIRHMDGYTLETAGEKERVIKCLEAAIRRRVSEGVSLELCATDRVGLLSEVTRILRENGLSVTRAGVTTVGDRAVNEFYVSDASGNPVDMKTIEVLRQEIGNTVRLNVKKMPSTSTKPPQPSGWIKTKFSFSLGSLLDRFLA